MNPAMVKRPTWSDEEALRAIAVQAGAPEAVVRAKYLEEKRQLETAACIRDFIPLLALKHVREDFLRAPPAQQARGSSTAAATSAVMLRPRVAAE